MLLTREGLLEATGGIWQGPIGASFSGGVSIDSRTLGTGDVFMAIKGDRFDGHDFIEAAMAKGASVVVVDTDVQVHGDVALIRVGDTTKALGQMAAWVRRQFKGSVIAITGSAGKTTTKEMIAAVLAQKYQVLKSERSENNHIGVPLTLLRLEVSTDVVVCEFGTNQPGDIAYLANIAQPTVAVFTNIGAAHLQGLGDIQGVYEEKVSFLGDLSGEAAIIYNIDDNCLVCLAEDYPDMRQINYSLKAASDYQAKIVNSLDSQEILFEVAGQAFQLNSPSRHNIWNALAAIACGDLFKIPYSRMSEALKQVKASSGRMQVESVGGCWVIDDTYNANPLSFQSAVASLHEFQEGQRRILVCGSMGELGVASAHYHAALAKAIADTSIDIVLTVGDEAEVVTDELEDVKVVYHFQTVDELIQHLVNTCQLKDVILVKGSRMMGLEKVVNFLKTHLQDSESN